MTAEQESLDLTRADGLPRCTITHPILGQCRGIVGSEHPHYGERNRQFAHHQCGQFKRAAVIENGADLA